MEIQTTNVLAELCDSNGVIHKITMRNLRAYHGRTMICRCGVPTKIDDAPLTCEAEACDLSPSELLIEPRHWWNQTQLEKSRVLMIGCGAIGNEIAKNLVMMGVRELSIVDFDEIEEHNLSRTVLFNKFSMEATKGETKYKTDVMKTGLVALYPEIDVTTHRTGVLDSISHRSGRYKKWKEDALGADKLTEMATNHDLCVVATDGIAPKSFIARILYPLLPMVQTAMNNNGSVVMVRSSLPLVTGCIMCPTKGEAIEIDEDGMPHPYYRMMREKTGAGGCEIFSEAVGAASFTDANAVAGSLAASQCINILMGWPQYRDSGFEKWPLGVPVPLWNEIHLCRPRDPASSSCEPLNNAVDEFGEFICVECTNLVQNTEARYATIRQLGGTTMFETPYESPRMEHPEGVEKPTLDRKLGS